MAIRTYNGKTPKIHPTAFVHPSAEVIGDVEIGANSSIWCNVSIRGDAWPIRIGKNVSIQDNAVLHSTQDENETVVENNVVIGHGAVVHACKVRQYALIGIGSIVLDGADIGNYAVVAAGSLVPPGMKVARETVVMGVPAKRVKKTDKKLKKYITEDVKTYKAYAELHKKTSKEAV